MSRPPPRLLRLGLAAWLPASAAGVRAGREGRLVLTVRDGESGRLTACRFFLEWLEERRRRVRSSDPLQRAQVLAHFDVAARFWRERLDGAPVPEPEAADSGAGTGSSRGRDPLE